MCWMVSSHTVILMKDQEDEKPQTIHKLSNFPYLLKVYLKSYLQSQKYSQL